MEAIFGQPTLPVCADAGKQHRLLQLLLHRHRDITVATAVALHDLTLEKLLLPLSSEVDAEEHITPYQLDENGERQGSWAYKDWANGFRFAILDYPEWHSLIDNPQNSNLMSPIVLFAIGFNPDYPEVQIDEQDDLLTLLSLCIYTIRDFWKRHQHAPALREASKVGRNDPCPCGSGKKYKKCCGA